MTPAPRRAARGSAPRSPAPARRCRRRSARRHRHPAPRVPRADDLHDVPARRLGHQRRHRHREHRAGAASGGDVHRHRRLVQGSRPPPDRSASPAPGSSWPGSAPAPGAVVATVPTEETTPGVVVPSGSVTRHRVARLDLRLLGDVQRDRHHVPVRRRRQHRPGRRAAQAAGHLADPQRLRLEHHLPQRQATPAGRRPPGAPPAAARAYAVSHE